MYCIVHVCVLIVYMFFQHFRSVMWLQRCCDEILERVRGGTLRKEEQYEYHVGRLRQDRVRVPRKEDSVS